MLPADLERRHRTIPRLGRARQRIRYRRQCGSGPAVALVHDGVTGAAGWDAILPDLCARFHVLRYDRRGMGLITR